MDRAGTGVARVPALDLSDLSGSETGGEASPAPHPAAPAALYGDLLAEVQRRRLFDDGKTFVDAVPRRSAADIVAAFTECPRNDEAVRTFVLDHFDLPRPAQVHAAHGQRDLRGYIRSLWPELIRAGSDTALGSRLPLLGPYVVPGGRFDELYYWDTYFSMLGLIRDGYEQLARDMVDRFVELIACYGHIPNGTRTYFLSRSHPPLLFAMMRLLPDDRPGVGRRRLSALLAEHRFWMSGSDRLKPGADTLRLVRMPDGTVLNRYWDTAVGPRDESYSEDLTTAAAAPDRPSAEVFRDLRAAAESGWDFSSRWFDAAAGLPGIRTTRIVPVDLNAFLYGLEVTAADLACQICEGAIADRMTRAADARRTAMTRWCWSDEGYFADHDLDRGCTGALTAAALAPLFVGATTPDQAAQVARVTDERLLASGGLRTTLNGTGEQWDWPNGWAPLQWIASEGLKRYGHGDLADEIARRWVATVDAEFQRTGWIFEKYDVEHGRSGQGGEYPPQLGFGWTNGITAAFADHILRR